MRQLQAKLANKSSTVDEQVVRLAILNTREPRLQLWCPTASSEGQLRGSLSQRVDLCTEAFCHLLGTFGLGNACQGHRKINENPIQQDCGQKVMWHNEVMLAFCRAIFWDESWTSIAWLHNPLTCELSPSWVPGGLQPMLANFWWVGTHRASTQHACHCTQISGVSYTGECKRSTVYLFIFPNAPFHYVHHDNPKITHLAVSENVVYLKVVMFIIFHTKNVDKWQCLNFKQVGFKVSQHYLEVI